MVRINFAKERKASVATNNADDFIPLFHHNENASSNNNENQQKTSTVSQNHDPLSSVQENSHKEVSKKPTLPLHAKPK